jgi:hypothetical protein
VKSTAWGTSGYDEDEGLDEECMCSYVAGTPAAAGFATSTQPHHDPTKYIKHQLILLIPFQSSLQSSLTRPLLKRLLGTSLLDTTTLFPPPYYPDTVIKMVKAGKKPMRTPLFGLVVIILAKTGCNSCSWCFRWNRTGKQSTS